MMLCQQIKLTSLFVTELPEDCYEKWQVKNDFTSEEPQTKEDSNV